MHSYEISSHFCRLEGMYSSYSPLNIFIFSYSSYCLLYFTLQTKEMHEAATCQFRVELKCGKKETKVLLEEAQQEYYSQFAHYFIPLFLQKIIYMSNLFIYYKIPFFSLFQIFLLGKHFMILKPLLSMI